MRRSIDNFSRFFAPDRPASSRRHLTRYVTPEWRGGAVVVNTVESEALHFENTLPAGKDAYYIFYLLSFVLNGAFLADAHFIYLVL